MAIYKPSNCAPFLGAVDLTLPVQNGIQEDINISFEVNCSNVTPVSAYKIKVLDNNNDIIFEGDEFTLVSPSWLSGTEQQVPLVSKTNKVIKSEDTTTWQRNHNIIYLWTETDEEGTIINHYCYYNGKAITDFVNGGTNQPYKWIITLAQGVTETNETIELPDVEENKWWDIPVTQGQILGSTPKRIQGRYSEYIYKDYFIQLIFINEAGVEEAIGNRARISGYDYSFGYIYPQEGQLTQENVNSANRFKIYRNTNDPQYIQTDRVANYIYKNDINAIQIGGKGPKTKFQLDTTSNSGGLGNSAGIYIITYEGDVRSSVLGIYQGIWPNFVQEASSVLFVNNSAPTATTNTGSGFSEAAENGVFAYISAEFKENNTVIKWQRTANYRNIASYLNKDIFVSGENYSNNASVGDIIGRSKLKFSNEKAIEIYPEEETDEAKTLGEVYKNTSETTYIRPSNNIKSGMRFSYIGSNDDKLRHTLIESYDDKKYCITHGYIAPVTPYSDTDGNRNTYTIESFFKISDENPFYAYAVPTIIIRNKDTGNEIGKEPSSIDTNIGTRYVTFSADFQQDDNKSWKNFQYELTDITTGNSQTGEKKYSGNIEDTFYGLQNGHTYVVTLVIEDEFSNIIISEGYFNVKINLVESDFPFTAVYDCLTHSVILDFIKDGIVIPNPNLDDQLWKDSNGKNIIVIQTDNNGNPAIIYKSGDTVPLLSDCQTNKYCYRYTDIDTNELVCGRFTEKSDQILLNKISAANDGLIYIGDLFYVRNSFYSDGTFPWSMDYRRVEGNQYKLILGNVSNDKDNKPDGYNALMEYKELKDGGSLPASETGNITFRSVHQIGTGFFEGSIVRYVVDTENYNNVPSRFKIDIIVPSVTNNGGDTMMSNIYDETEKTNYVNEDRNGIYVRIVREVKNTESDVYTELPQTIIKKWFDIYEFKDSHWIKTNFDAVEGRYWQKKNPVVSSWINEDWISNPNFKTEGYDFIDTEYFYGEKGVTGYKNMRGEGLLAAGKSGNDVDSIKIIPPFQSAGTQSSNETVWYDIATVEGTQANNTAINAFGQESIWQDKDKEGNDYCWQDKPAGAPVLYQQVDINNLDGVTNYSGRQNITSKKFLFNLVLKNYDDKKKQLTTINADNILAQCYMLDVQ